MLEPRFTMIDNGNGTWTVKDVPVFAECTYGDRHFAESWVDEALANMTKEQASGHLFPMHIHHTTDKTAVVEPAGAFMVTRKGPVRLRDEVKPGLIGDLTFTDKKAAERCKNFQLLWRSPEIPKSGPARLRSLALLDREAPHLPMEVLAVRDGGKAADGAKPTSVPAATWSLAADGPVLAFSERESIPDSIFALMEPLTMTVPVAPAAPSKPKYRRKADGTMVRLNDAGAEEVIVFEEEKPKGDDAPPPPADKGGDDDESEGGDDEAASESDGAGKSDPVQALLDKIKGLKLTREQHQALEAGIAEIFKDEEPDAAAAQPAPVSDAPGGIAMKESPEVIALREKVTDATSRLKALEIENKARAESEARRAAVAKGMARLASKAMPASTESDLLAFAEAGGVEAVERTVALLEKTLPPRIHTLSDALKGDPTDGTPAEVLAFHAKGADAYQAAQHHARTHAALVKAGMTSFDLKTFLDLKMGDGTKAFRAGFTDQE